MCGISGAITTGNIPKQKLLQLISHRGPDSHGMFEDDNVFLAHTRLSIQDLSENGNQPMHSADGNYVMIFNGEIYNHLDVRKKLEDDFAFRSTGDTETVLNAYIKFGEACLNMLNGIFALAIYNKQTKELFIARDQLGVKPLYIYQDDERFLFSSEMKSFLAFDIDKSIDHLSLSNYLSFLWSPGAKTPFSKVRKLLPGHYIKINAQNIDKPTEAEYYQIPFKGNYSAKSEEELIDELEQKLLKAVERQMLSDVPVGFFLSGGLDSSLLVAMAKKQHPEKRFQCFTIDTLDLEDSEGFAGDLHYAKKVAEHVDVELNIVKASIDIVKDFDKMIWHLDEPQADAAPLNVLNICQFARDKGIKVLIGGTAGDDLFSGYRRHQALNFEKYFKAIPAPVGKLLKRSSQLLPANVSAFRRVRKLVSDLDKSADERMLGYFSWIPEPEKKKLFSLTSQQALNGYLPTQMLGGLLKNIPSEKSKLNQMLYLEMKSFLVDHNLNYTDKLSMAVGVEARVPYLDLELVEYATTIPPQFKMKGKDVKYILKKVAERYLPHDVIYRPKTGFGAPVRKWVTEDLDEMIADRLAPAKIKARGLFNEHAVWDLIKANKQGKIDASYTIWSLLAIESWMQQFADGKKLF